MEFIVKDIVIGPVLKRADGYVVDTWSADAGMRCGYPYRRVEDAHYARNVMIASARGATICQTLDEFIARFSVGTIPIAA